MRVNRARMHRIRRRFASLLIVVTSLLAVISPGDGAAPSSMDIINTNCPDVEFYYPAERRTLPCRPVCPPYKTTDENIEFCKINCRKFYDCIIDVTPFYRSNASPSDSSATDCPDTFFYHSGRGELCHCSAVCQNASDFCRTNCPEFAHCMFDGESSQRPKLVGQRQTAMPPGTTSLTSAKSTSPKSTTTTTTPLPLTSMPKTTAQAPAGTTVPVMDEPSPAITVVKPSSSHNAVLVILLIILISVLVVVIIFLVVSCVCRASRRRKVVNDPERSALNGDISGRDAVCSVLGERCTKPSPVPDPDANDPDQGLRLSGEIPARLTTEEPLEADHVANRPETPPSDLRLSIHADAPMPCWRNSLHASGGGIQSISADAKSPESRVRPEVCEDSCSSWSTEVDPGCSSGIGVASSAPVAQLSEFPLELGATERGQVIAQPTDGDDPTAECNETVHKAHFCSFHSDDGSPGTS